MSPSMNNPVGTTIIRQKDLLNGLKELLDKDPALKEILADAYKSGNLLNREYMVIIISNMNPTHYSLFYRKIKPLGFSPSLLADADKNSKEKMRVASFLVRLFESLPKDLSALFSV